MKAPQIDAQRNLINQIEIISKEKELKIEKNI